MGSYPVALAPPLWPNANAVVAAIAFVLLAVIVGRLVSALQQAHRKRAVVVWAVVVGACAGVLWTAVGGMLGLPDDPLAYWTVPVEDALTRALVGAMAGATLVTVGFVYRRACPVGRAPILAWTIFGAFAGFVLGIITGGFSISDLWRMFRFDRTTPDAWVHAQIGTIVGAVLGGPVSVVLQHVRPGVADRAGARPALTRWQFSLRTLFWMVFVVAGVLSLLVWDHRHRKARALRTLAEAVESTDYRTIDQVLPTLYRLGAGKETSAMLLDMLEGEDSGTGPAAGYALEKAAPDLVPQLIDVLRHDPDARRRRLAVMLLYPRHSNAHPAAGVRPLMEALANDEDAQVREQAIYRLTALEAEPPGLVPLLIMAVKDEDAAVRLCAASALGVKGPEARDALPVLHAALDDNDTWVALQVAGAIGQIDGTQFGQVETRLLQWLKDPDRNVRMLSAREIGHIGPAARSAAPALLEALDDPEACVRSAAISALGSIRSSNEETINALLAALESDETRCPAAGALGKLAPESRAAIPRLIEMLEDESSGARWAAAEALGKFAPAATEAIPALVERLEDENGSVRAEAAIALGEFGPAASDAIPELIELLPDDVGNIPWDAVNALKKINPSGMYRPAPDLTDMMGGFPCPDLEDDCGSPPQDRSENVDNGP